MIGCWVLFALGACLRVPPAMPKPNRAELWKKWNDLNSTAREVALAVGMGQSFLELIDQDQEMEKLGSNSSQLAMAGEPDWRSGIPRGSNQPAPAGFVAKRGSGQCRCRGGGMGLDSCGPTSPNSGLCCAASPNTDPDPNGKNPAKSASSLCYERSRNGPDEGSIGNVQTSIIPAWPASPFWSTLSMNCGFNGGEACGTAVHHYYNLRKDLKRSQGVWQKYSKGITDGLKEMLEPVSEQLKNDATLLGTTEGERATWEGDIDGKILTSQTEAGTYKKAIIASRKEQLILMEEVIAQVGAELELDSESMAEMHAQVTEIFMETLEKSQDTDTSQVEEIREWTKDNAEVATEDDEAVSDTILEQNGVVKEYKGTVQDAFKVVHKILKTCEKEMKVVKKFVTGEVQKIDEAASTFPMALAAKRMSGVMAANGIGTSVVSLTEKELGGSVKEMDGMLKQGKSAVQEKDKEEKEASQEEKATLTESLIEEKKSSQESQEESLDTQLRFDDHLENTLENSTKLVKETARDARKNDEVVGGIADTYTRKLKDAVSASDQNRAKATRSFSVDIEKMNRKISAQGMHETEKISTEFGNEATEMADHFRETQESLGAHAGKLDEEMARTDSVFITNKKRSKQLDRVFAGIIDAGKTAYATVSGDINATKNKALTDIDKFGVQESQKIAEEDESIKNSAEKTRSQDLNAIVDLAAQEGTKLEQVKVEATTKLEKTDRKVASAQRSNGRLISSFESVSRDIETQAGTTGEAMTDTKAGVVKMGDEIKADIEKVKERQAAEFGRVVAAVGQAGKDVSAEASKELADAGGNLRKDFGDEKTALKRKYDGMYEDANRLKADGEKDFRENHATLVSLDTQIAKSVTDAEKSVEESGAEGVALRAKMSETKNKIKETTRAEDLKERALQDQLTQGVGGAFKDALRRDNFKTSKVKEEMTMKLQQGEDTAAAGIQKDEAKLKTYMSETTGQMHKQQSEVTSIGLLLAKDEGDVISGTKAYETKIASQGQQANDMIGRGVADLERQKEHLADETERLHVLAANGVAEYEQYQNGNLKGLNHERSSIYTNEAESSTMTKSKMIGQEDQWSGRMEVIVEDIDKAAANSKMQMSALENQERQSSSGMMSSVGGLDTAIETGEQKIGGAIMNNEEEAGKNANGALGGMEGLLGGFSQAKQAGGGGIDKMEQSFTDELEYYKMSGQNAEGAIASKVKDLEDSAPDLAKSFEDGIKPARSNLLATEKKFEESSAQMAGQMRTFDEELAGIKHNRETTASKYHHETTAWKAATLTTFEDQLADVDKVRTGALEAFGKLEDRQKKFDKGLATVNGFEANHDDGKIKEVQDKANTLEKGHGKLLDWQKYFKHRTIAWRDEVERQLKKLDGNIENEVLEENEARMNEELDANGQMRSVQRGVEDEVTDAAKRQAGAMSNLVDGMQQQMAAVVGGEDKMEGADGASMDRIGQLLHNSENGAHAIMANLHSQQVGIADKGAAFRTEVAKESEGLSNQLLLPSMSIGASNLRTDTAMQAVATQISQMGGASFAETDAKQETEEQALLSLNAEMKRENAHLRSLDEKLEGKVKIVAEKLEKHVPI